MRWSRKPLNESSESSNPSPSASMIRKLLLVYNTQDYGLFEPGRAKHFVCAGNGCKKCQIRFLCFTESKSTVLEICWSDLKHYKGRSNRRLRRLTGSRVYSVDGTKYSETVAKQTE